MDKRKAILSTILSIMLAVIFVMILYIATRFAVVMLQTKHITVDGDMYAASTVIEGTTFVLILLLTMILGKLDIMKSTWKSFKAGFGAGAFLFVYLTFSAVVMIGIGIINPQSHFVSAPKIIAFTLYMLFIGLTEEFMFRGLIQNYLVDAYGKTKIGTISAIVVASIIFGEAHIINAVGALPLKGVVYQMLGAAALGMYIGAVYARCNNIWVVALMHALMDFVALINSGLFGVGSMETEVASYDASQLFAVVLYVALALFVLRSAKMNYEGNDKDTIENITLDDK